MTQANVKQTTPGIRVILYVASILVLAVSLSLFFFPGQTAVYFSWTINPPLTAAFLGAGYLSSFLLELLSARERIWARARPAVPAVWAFTFLTLIVTLLHLDRFHFDSPALITVAGTWVWLAVYVTVPIAMGVLWLHQVQQPGVDPPRLAPLPAWFRGVLVGQGATMLLLGAVLLILPGAVSPVWPWTLSALTGRAIGAWGAGIGIIALHAAWENDGSRLWPTMLSYALYGALQLINIGRFPATIVWTAPAFVYTAFMVSIFLAGSYGLWASRPDR